MKILVIDKDTLTNQLITSKLSSRGHEVVVEVNKNQAIEMLGEQNFDCIILDPTPLSEARPVILSIWRIVKARTKPYIILLTKNEEMTTDQAILSGNNDFIMKPFDMGDVEDKMSNAERFIEVCKYLDAEDKMEDTKGIINKNAFNQLFLSALDRAFRYGERSLIVFINISNYEHIKKLSGKEGLDHFDNKMAEKMNLMRRQSDVIGRIGEADYAILLQRPLYEAEPLDAIVRFADVLNKLHAEFIAKESAPCFDLDLVEIPQGILHSRKQAPYVERENFVDDQEEVPA